LIEISPERQKKYFDCSIGEVLNKLPTSRGVYISWASWRLWNCATVDSHQEARHAAALFQGWGIYVL